MYAWQPIWLFPWMEGRRERRWKTQRTMANLKETWIIEKFQARNTWSYIKLLLIGRWPLAIEEWTYGVKGISFQSYIQQKHNILACTSLECINTVTVVIRRRFPFSQNCRDFRSKIRRNGKSSPSFFRKFSLGLRLNVLSSPALVEFPKLPKFLCSIRNECQIKPLWLNTC